MATVRPLLRWTVAFAALLATLPTYAQADEPSMEPSVPSLSNDQIRRLNNGEVLVDVISGAVPVGDALGVINATPQQVYDVIRDFSSQHEWMSDMTESQVLSEDGDHYTCRGTTDTPWPMRDRTYTLNAWAGPSTVDGTDVLLATWEYVPGSGNIVDTKGYWLMIPWGDNGQQTLLRYHLYVDLGTWLPGFLLTWSTENFLPDKITDLRHRLGV